MLNNLTNFFNLITSKRIKKVLEPSDLIAIGTKQSKTLGDYKPTAILFSDLEAQIIANIPITPPAVWTDTNVIFVSPNGSDTDPGTLQEPVKSLYVARNLAAAGDLVYVLPGTWTFDNTNANGNYYNGANMDLYLNLWKDQVSYYFSPGTKVTLLNQTVTGSPISLFRPKGGANTTCNVYGSLEFSSSSIGVNSFNGTAYLFLSDNTFGYDYTCNMEIYKGISYSADLIRLERSVGITTVLSNFDFKAMSMTLQYSGGQSGSGSIIFLGDATKTKATINIDTAISNNNGIYPRNNTDVTLNVNYLRTQNEMIFVRALSNSIITANITTGYFTSKVQSGGGAIMSLYQSSSNRIKITGNFYEYASVDVPLIGINGGSGNSVILNGSIFINNTNLTTGRQLVIDYNTNKTFINANVEYTGNASSNVPFYLNSTGLIVFEGYMYGTFNGSLAYPLAQNGKIVIKNSRIDFTTTPGAVLLNPASPVLGIIVIENSTILISSTTDAAGPGVWFILNSSIKNTAPFPGVMFVNATATIGLSLNVLNSTLINRGALAINYTNAAPVVNLAGAVSNSTASAVTLNGVLTTVSTINIQ